MAHAARAAALGQGLCVEFLAEIGTKQPLFDNFAVSVVNGDAARLVEFGQPARLLDRGALVGDGGARHRLAFFRDAPTPVAQVNPIDMPS